jgi:hypothetical protein
MKDRGKKEQQMYQETITERNYTIEFRETAVPLKEEEWRGGGGEKKSSYTH